jgi:hypothetical protein
VRHVAPGHIVEVRIGRAESLKGGGGGQQRLQQGPLDLGDKALEGEVTTPLDTDPGAQCEVWLQSPGTSIQRREGIVEGEKRSRSEGAAGAAVLGGDAESRGGGDEAEGEAAAGGGPLGVDGAAVLAEEDASLTAVRVRDGIEAQDMEGAVPADDTGGGGLEARRLGGRHGAEDVEI